jgi:hypothetical protein
MAQISSVPSKMDFGSYAKKTQDESLGYLNQPYQPDAMTQGAYNKYMAFDPTSLGSFDANGGFSFGSGGMRPTPRTLGDMSTWMDFLGSNEKSAVADNAKNMANAGIQRGGFGGDRDPYAQALASTNATVGGMRAGNAKQAGDWLNSAYAQDAAGAGHVLDYMSHVGDVATNFGQQGTQRYDTGLNTGVQLSSLARGALQDEQQAGQFDRTQSLTEQQYADQKERQRVADQQAEIDRRLLAGTTEDSRIGQAAERNAFTNYSTGLEGIKDLATIQKLKGLLGGRGAPGGALAGQTPGMILGGKQSRVSSNSGFGG